MVLATAGRQANKRRTIGGTPTIIIADYLLDRLFLPPVSNNYIIYCSLVRKPDLWYEAPNPSKVDVSDRIIHTVVNREQHNETMSVHGNLISSIDRVFHSILSLRYGRSQKTPGVHTSPKHCCSYCEHLYNASIYTMIALTSLSS